MTVFKRDDANDRLNAATKASLALAFPNGGPDIYNFASALVRF